MTMETDEGKEVINSSSPVLKENFKGYWTFGAPVIPSGVSDIPSSLFFEGALDDIMCVNDANDYLNPYMTGVPILAVSPSALLPECIPGTLSFEIPYSQKGVEYSVWNKTLSSWGPLTAIGTGGKISFGEANITIGTNEFMVVAKNIASGCDIMLDTVFAIEVLSFCTALPDEADNMKMQVFPVPANDIIYFKSAVLIRGDKDIR
jgi:hypothetical protein